MSNVRVSTTGANSISEWEWQNLDQYSPYRTVPRSVSKRNSLEFSFINSSLAYSVEYLHLLLYTHALYALFYTIGQIKCNPALFGTTYCCIFPHVKRPHIFPHTVSRMPISTALTRVLSFLHSWYVQLLPFDNIYVNNLLVFLMNLFFSIFE